MFNRGRAVKAENKRLCKEFLNKGMKQREIAKALKISLPTVNKYCQEIAKEIEKKQKAFEDGTKEEARRRRERKARAKEIAEEIAENKSAIQDLTPEELAKQGFTACLLELKMRLPTMTNEEVMKITVDLWDRVNK